MTTSFPDSRLADVRVEDTMHQGLVTCSPTTPLRAVARMFAAHRIHAVVVADDRGHDAARIWGVLSDLDLVRRLAAGEDEDAVAGMASEPACYVAPGDSLARAARLMAEHAATHLVVVEPVAGRPVGILSTLDVAGALAGY